MKWVSLFWVASLVAQTTLARPAQIILLRHAEKPADDFDVHLSPRGEERALALATFLTTTSALLSNGPPVALFASQPTPHQRGSRASETLEPLAEHLKLRIRTPYLSKDYAALAKQLLKSRSYEGKTVVVCWVHEWLPELAESLGVEPKPESWKKNVYDRVWVIRYSGKEASLASLPQHLLPGDSRR